MQISVRLKYMFVVTIFLRFFWNIFFFFIVIHFVDLYFPFVLFFLSFFLSFNQ